MKKEVKTSIDGLEIGMFVARLDRPWLKTPYQLQGVMIRSSEDIERLRRYCNYVYVDVEQGASPAPRFWVLQEGPKSYTTARKTADNRRLAHTSHTPEPRNEYSALRKTRYQVTTRIDTEFQASAEAYENFRIEFQQALSNLKDNNDFDISSLNESISSVVDSIIRNPGAMTLVVKLKQLDDYSYSRSLGTSIWCATFGRHLGLEKSAIESLALGGLLLDVGKSSIPRDLLQKPEKLTQDETTLVRTHVDNGIRMLSSASRKSLEEKLPMDVLQMVATHHERADGNGYPQGLTNRDIPIFGRIAGIVDSFDAMTSERPYAASGPMSPHEAITELYELRGTQFQAELVEQFIQTVGLYPTGSLVELNTGEVGAVIAVNGLRRLRPSVMLLLDKNKEPLDQFRYIDLSLVDDELAVARGLPPGAHGINMKEIFL